jgi:hypothetical protein
LIGDFSTSERYRNKAKGGEDRRGALINLV